MTTSDAELARLNALYEKATPGEWRLRNHEFIDTPNIIEGDIVPNGDDWRGKWICTFPVLVPELREQQKVDAALIAAPHNAYPALREQLREMAAEIADLKGHADGWMEVAREAEDRLAAFNSAVTAASGTPQEVTPGFPQQASGAPDGECSEQRSDRGHE